MIANKRHMFHGCRAMPVGLKVQWLRNHRPKTKDPPNNPQQTNLLKMKLK